MCAVFSRAMDGESENPPGVPLGELALSGKLLSFGYLFFAAAKKSNSPKAKAFDSKTND
jgi:hypothetical protein